MTERKFSALLIACAIAACNGSASDDDMRAGGGGKADDARASVIGTWDADFLAPIISVTLFDASTNDDGARVYGFRRRSWLPCPPPIAELPPHPCDPAIITQRGTYRLTGDSYGGSFIEFYDSWDNLLDRWSYEVSSNGLTLRPEGEDGEPFTMNKGEPWCEEVNDCWLQNVPVTLRCVGATLACEQSQCISICQLPPSEPPPETCNERGNWCLPYSSANCLTGTWTGDPCEHPDYACCTEQF